MTAVSSPEAVEAAAARPVEAVVIGASAGGFEALLAILKDLPATYPMPLVAVLHLPENDYSFSLSCEDRVAFARPSIDVLFASAADAYGKALAGILLTGANYDGAAGLAGMQVAGALTIVQDPASAEVPTMPEAAIRRMTPDLILPLAEIRSLLCRLGDHQ